MAKDENASEQRANNMRLELVVASISIFQIYHQAASSTLALLASTLDLTPAYIATAAAAFPLGKLVGTLAAVPLFSRYTTSYACLDACAIGLTLGALLMIAQS